MNSKHVVFLYVCVSTCSISVLWCAFAAQRTVQKRIQSVILVIDVLRILECFKYANPRCPGDMWESCELMKSDLKV